MGAQIPYEEQCPRCTHWCGSHVVEFGRAGLRVRCRVCVCPCDFELDIPEGLAGS